MTDIDMPQHQQQMDDLLLNEDHKLQLKTKQFEQNQQSHQDEAIKWQQTEEVKTWLDVQRRELQAEQDKLHHKVKELEGKHSQHLADLEHERASQAAVDMSNSKSPPDHQEAAKVGSELDSQTKSPEKLRNVDMRHPQTSLHEDTSISSDE